MKRIGLIGGTGWIATRDYYTRLNEKCAARRGRLHSADLVIRSLDFQRLLDGAGDRDAVQALIDEAATDLAAAQAQVMALASHTGHLFAAGLAERTGLPLVDISAACARALDHAGVPHVGVLGTAMTMDSGLLATALRDAGVEPVLPAAAARERLHAAIFGELEHGRVGPLTHAALQECEDGFAAAGLRDVLLACTELPLAYVARRSPLRIWDSVDIHCDALLDAAQC